MIHAFAVPRNDNKPVIPVDCHSAKAIAFPTKETKRCRIVRMQEGTAILECSFEDATKERIIQRFVFLAAIDPRNPLVLESDIRHS